MPLGGFSGAAVLGGKVRGSSRVFLTGLPKTPSDLLSDITLNR